MESESVMAYRLKAKESVPHGLRRIVREELKDAIRQLSKNSNRDEAIHEARKSIKKVRAALKLVRRELGSTYHQENSRLRDAAHMLSVLRDAGAMITTFDAVRDHDKKHAKGRSEKNMRRILVTRKAQVEREHNLEQLLPRVSESVADARDLSSGWPPRRGGFTAMEKDFEKTFRDGRKAMAKLQKDRRPELFHELRKRVKDHWYHVRLLENLWDEMMIGYEKTLKDLESRLGDDHNLVLLHDLVAAEPERYGKPSDIRSLYDKIASYQKEVRREALDLAKRIYSERPRKLVKRFRALWTVWHKSHS